MSELIQLANPNQRPPQLKPEDLTLRFSEQAVKELEALISHYPSKKSCILPGLWLAQREYGGFLSGEAIAEVACRLDRSFAEVQGVATFYSLYNTAHQPGKHKLEICTCLCCHINGAWNLRDYLVKKLGIRHGETTSDGMFTLEEVECLNTCDRAPAMQVGSEYYGPLDEKQIDALLEKLRNTQESTVVQYAADVVSVQLRNDEK
ncbi:MAG: NAD(P)H-dependent oxidoreductase subunit E [Fimbriimonas sp.]|nr:NAD(P)H-dependent oxidoreductase subunit E [Fimbriimonas sp.]